MQTIENIFSDFKAEVDELTFIKSVNPDSYLSHAMKARMAEAEALVYLATETPYPFHKALRGLTHALDDTVKALETRIAATIDVPVDNPDPEAHDAAVTEQIERREQAQAWLDQARISAVLTLVHLSKAIHELDSQPTNLKAV